VEKRERGRKRALVEVVLKRGERGSIKKILHSDPRDREGIRGREGKGKGKKKKLNFVCCASETKAASRDSKGKTCSTEAARKRAFDSVQGERGGWKEKGVRAQNNQMGE